MTVCDNINALLHCLFHSLFCSKPEVNLIHRTATLNLSYVALDSRCTSALTGALTEHRANRKSRQQGYDLRQKYSYKNEFRPAFISGKGVMTKAVLNTKKNFPTLKLVRNSLQHIQRSKIRVEHFSPYVCHRPKLLPLSKTEKGEGERY
jgi:hypothetical protein